MCTCLQFPSCLLRSSCVVPVRHPTHCSGSPANKRTLSVSCMPSKGQSAVFPLPSIPRIHTHLLFINLLVTPLTCLCLTPFCDNNIVIQNITNKTTDTYSTSQGPMKREGEREGHKNTKVTPLYNHVYPTKNTAKHQWSKAWPHHLAIVHSHDTICRRLWIQYVFLHMCGVNQFWIIVFFAAVKPANNILFCIELIQRPESSLRRHKLGLTDQSIRSNDDKTRFTCVHRLMTTGHSQNICRKVPDDVVLHIWQFKFD